MNDIDRLEKEIHELKERIDVLENRPPYIVTIPYVPYVPTPYPYPYEPYRYTWCSTSTEATAKL